MSKPSDLIPELQGRFPIRVELEPLSQEDLVRILTEPRNALIKQYQALLATEGVEVTFTDDAIREMARFAMEVNQATENIGARRLATILETVLEELSFEGGSDGPRAVRLDAAEIRARLAPAGRRSGLEPVHSVRRAALRAGARAGRARACGKRGDPQPPLPAHAPGGQRAARGPARRPAGGLLVAPAVTDQRVPAARGARWSSLRAEGPGAARQGGASGAGEQVAPGERVVETAPLPAGGHARAGGRAGALARCAVRR